MDNKNLPHPETVGEFWLRALTEEQQETNRLLRKIAGEETEAPSNQDVTTRVKESSKKGNKK